MSSNTNKKKIHLTNMINKNDPINITSITTQKNLLNKFQICLGKLNDNSTKELAFNQIKDMISKNTHSPASLRSYLSALGSYNSKTSNLSQSAKELQCLLYGYISSVYKENLYDPLDNPPNLIKTINRMLSQLRNSYLNEQSYIIHKACAHSYSELLIQSMPKDSNTLIISIFFDPLLGLIATGSSKYIQDGAAICLCDLIDCIGNGQCGPEISGILDEISTKVISQLLKGPVSDNIFILDALYKLMTFVNFEHFTLFLKEMYDRLIAIIKQKNISYQGKISVLNIFGLIAEGIADVSDIAIGYYQQEVVEVIKEMTKDRIHKVQVAARQSLYKWNDLEKIFKANEKGKYVTKNKQNELFENDISFGEKIKNKLDNDPFKFAYIDERDYKVRNIMKKEKEKISNLLNNRKDRYNTLFSSNDENTKINANEPLEDISQNQVDYSFLSPPQKINTQKENDTTKILKLTLSNLIKTSLESSQNKFYDSINSRLDQLDRKIYRITNKVKVKFPNTNPSNPYHSSSFRAISKERTENPNRNSITEIKTNEIWKKSLELLDNQKYDQAYNDVLSSEDDIYLLRLVCLTGPIINSLNDMTAQKVLNRINMINRGYQIQNVLVDLVSQSITNKNIFWKMNYKEQNDILDSLYQIGNNSGSPFSEKAKQLYNLIISKANNNTNV